MIVMKKVAIFPGSFDPMTIGHLSVLQRGLQIFDEIVMVVGVNSAKHNPDSIAARIADVESRVAGIDGVRVLGWDGLTAEAAKKVGAHHILRGVRSVADYEYELSLADINRRIAGLETVLLPTLPEQSMISASMIRELRSYGYDTTEFEA